VVTQSVEHRLVIKRYSIHLPAEHCCTVILGKLFTPTCLCHQAV